MHMRLSNEMQHNNKGAIYHKYENNIPLGLMCKADRVFIFS